MEKKKFLGAGIAFFVMFLMVCSATAVPVVNQKAVEKELKGNSNQDVISTTPPQGLNTFLLRLLKTMNHFGFNGPLASTLDDGTIISNCWAYYNNDTFREQLNMSKASLMDEINQYPEQDRVLLMQFFDVNNTFSIEGIYQRISSLHVGTVKEDTMSLLKTWVPGDSDQTFNNTRTEPLQNLLTLFYNNDFQNDDMYYPVVDKICHLLTDLSLLWAVPLTILGGLTGLMVSTFVTMVFFAPITAPIALYISLDQCFKNDPTFRQDITDIAVMYGLVGLIVMGTTKIIVELMTTSWGMSGWEYIIDHLAINKLNQNGDSYELSFGEQAPLIFGGTFDVPAQTKKDVQFQLDISDNDHLQYKTNSELRDSYQIGIDYIGNDHVVDKWEPLGDYPNDGLSTIPVTVPGYNKAGDYKINVLVRDNWGVYNTNTGNNYAPWATITVHVTRSKDMAYQPFFQNLLQHFPMLEHLLEKLLGKLQNR